MRLLLGLVLLTAGILRADEAGDRNKVEDMRVEISPAQAQERAVRTVQRLGGHVQGDLKAGGQPLLMVRLDGTQATNADLEELAALPQLRFLCLASTKVTDAGLTHLAAMKQLRVLHLEGTQVTEAGVQELQQALPGCRIHH